MNCKRQTRIVATCIVRTSTPKTSTQNINVNAQNVPKVNVAVNCENVDAECKQSMPKTSWLPKVNGDATNYFDTNGTP